MKTLNVFSNILSTTSHIQIQICLLIKWAATVDLWLFDKYAVTLCSTFFLCSTIILSYKICDFSLYLLHFCTHKTLIGILLEAQTTALVVVLMWPFFIVLQIICWFISWKINNSWHVAKLSLNESEFCSYTHDCQSGGQSLFSCQ